MTDISPEEHVESYVDLRSGPFQGGYVEFIPTTAVPAGSRRVRQPTAKLSRRSMLEDLCYYFQEHAQLYTETAWTNPLTSSVFLRKMIAALYMQVVNYLKASIPAQELRLTTSWVEERDQWLRLFDTHTRTMNFCDDMTDILRTEFSISQHNSSIFLKGLTGPADDPWRIERDFKQLYEELKKCNHRLTSMRAPTRGVCRIARGAQSMYNRKSNKRLSALTILFAPLLIVS